MRRPAFIRVGAVLLGLGITAGSDPARAQRAVEPPSPKPATAEEAAYPRNQLRLGALFGVSTNFDDPYFQLGATFGWTIVRGLELGVDATALLIEDPFIFQLTPGLRYVFVDVPFLQPYVGFLYRRSFIDGDDDLSTMGGRVGVSWDSGEGLVLSGGLAYERAFDCEETNFNGCNGFHPELGISVVF